MKIKARMSAIRKMNEEELQNYLNQTRKSAHVFANKKRYNKKKERQLNNKGVY